MNNLLQQLEIGKLYEVTESSFGVYGLSQNLGVMLKLHDVVMLLGKEVITHPNQYLHLTYLLSDGTVGENWLYEESAVPLKRVGP